MNNQSSRYERRILLAITGLTPQVVTETLYALHAEAITEMPTEVHLLSTEEGVERARLTLLSDEPGGFHRLCRDCTLPPMHFGEAYLHTLLDARGEPLSDIRTPEDNECAANGITDWIRRLTEDPHTQLHVSIAGGRKTMGFYAGYALSLYGRPQDRLSHVLVKPPYESHPEFFYPTPHSRVIYTLGTDPKPLDTRGAEVTLAEIPFVRMRHGLPDALLKGRGSFSDTVQVAQISFGPPKLELNLRKKQLVAGGKVVKLPAAELAFYAWLARRTLNGLEPLSCPPDGAPNLDYALAFLREYREIVGEFGDDERVAQTFTRFGRHGDIGVHLGNPFKTPVLLAQTGAVFSPHLSGGGPGVRALLIGQGLGGDGSLSKAIPETVHQGYAPVVGIRLPQREAT